MCFISPSYHQFFVRRDFYQLCVQLAAKGFDINVIAFSNKEDTGTEIIEGVKVYKLPLIFNIPAIIYPIPNIAALFKTTINLIKNLKPDIIHMWDYIFPNAFISFLLKNKNIFPPLILTTDCLPGISWFWGNKLVDFIAKAYTLTIGKKILRSQDLLVLLSAYYVHDALQIGVPKEKIRVVLPGIDTEKFNPDINGEKVRNLVSSSSSDVLISFIGRMVPVKDIPTLIQAANKVLQKSDDIKFILIGDGAYKEKYEELASGNPNIIFTGYQKNIAEWIAASDIVVLPSLSEGVPNVILEAAACGKPVIASKVGGIPSVIKDKTTGLLFEPKNENQLYESLMKLIDDPSLRKKMGKAARKRVVYKCSLEVYVNNYEKIYDILK